MPSWCIVYLASPKDRPFGPVDGVERRVEILKASLEGTKRVFPTTDIFIFHEDFDDSIQQFLPPVKEYIQVDFSGHEDVFVKHAFPKGYILMCRFFSGILQRTPQLQAYTHYMRLDDDSYFHAPWITETQVNAMCSHDYVYRSVFYDLKDHQSLYEETLAFVSENGYAKHIPELKRWLTDRNVIQRSHYTGIAPYNNFHVSSLRLWSHPLVAAYVDRLEAKNGCLTHGWLDANIHAMIIWVLCPLIGMHVHHEGGFGYRHNKHVSHMNSDKIEWQDHLPFVPKDGSM